MSPIHATLGVDGKVSSEQLPTGQGGAAWGAVTGTLSDQTDLQTALDGKSATGHTHTGVYEPADAAIQSHIISAHAPANAEQNVNADWNSGAGDSQILNKPALGTAAAKDIPASGDASATEVVYGTDTRLTNARTPSAHSHVASDVTGTAVLTNDSRLSDARQLAAGADKTKLDGIAAGAEVNVNADWNSESGDSQILNKPAILAFNDAEGDPANVAAAAADGTSSYAARRDHVHTGALLTAAFSGLAKISVGTSTPVGPSAGITGVPTS